MNVSEQSPEMAGVVAREQDQLESSPRKRRKRNDGSASPGETSNGFEGGLLSKVVPTASIPGSDELTTAVMWDLSSKRSVTATNDELQISSSGSSTSEQPDVDLKPQSSSFDVVHEMGRNSEDDRAGQLPNCSSDPEGLHSQTGPFEWLRDPEQSNLGTFQPSPLMTGSERSDSKTLATVFEEDVSSINYDIINPEFHIINQPKSDTVEQGVKDDPVNQVTVLSDFSPDIVLPLAREGTFSFHDVAHTSASARSLRKRKATRSRIDNPLEEVMKPLSAEERTAFSGWVEVESEPALFEHILKQNGVADFNIQEIYDIETMAGVEKSKHTHGIIFLFQYDENDAQEWSAEARCPESIWFANQVVDYACATVALMNIVMNSRILKLGKYLDSFRERTRKMKPTFRGRALGHDNFIRNNHNSFMRRIEMITANLCLQQEHTKHEKARKQGKPIRKTTASRSKKKKNDEDGFHYIAFVPVDGSVWRFDGLLQQPTNIGSYTDDWLSVAQINISSRISYGEQTHFNLMVLRDDLLSDLKLKAAGVIKTLVVLERKLDELNAEWQAFTEEKIRPREEIMFSCGLQQADIDKAKTIESAAAALQSSSLEGSLKMWHELYEVRDQLENEYMEELSNLEENKDIVDRRLHDLTPDIYHAINALSRDGALKEIVMGVAAAAEEDSKVNGGGEGWKVFPR